MGTKYDVYEKKKNDTILTTNVYYYRSYWWNPPMLLRSIIFIIFRPHLNIKVIIHSTRAFYVYLRRVTFY